MQQNIEASALPKVRNRLEFTTFVGDNSVRKTISFNGNSCDKVGDGLKSGIGKTMSMPALALGSYLEAHINSNVCLSASIHKETSFYAVVPRPALHHYEGRLRSYGDDCGGVEDYLEYYSKTKDNYTFDTDGLGILHIDCDPKPGMKYLSPKKLILLLEKHFPAFKKLHVYAKASSSNVKVNGVKLSESGYHLYAIVPMRLIEPIGIYLFKTLWANGYGHVYNSVTGSQLLGGYVDKVVFGAGRIIYTANPILNSPELTQNDDPIRSRKGDESFYEKGDWSEFHNLQADESLFQKEVLRLKSINKPESKRLQKIFFAKREKDLISKGHTPKQAKRIVDNNKNDMLSMNDWIRFDTLGWKQIKNCMHSTFQGLTCYDPFEYDDPKNGGPNKAVFYPNIGQDRGPIVFTHIHGSSTYQIIDTDMFSLSTKKDMPVNETPARKEQIDSTQSNLEDTDLDEIDLITRELKKRKIKPKIEFLKPLKITYADIVIAREPYNFLIEMPEPYTAFIIRRDLRKVGKDFVRANYDTNSTYEETELSYKSKYYNNLNPELKEEWFCHHPEYKPNATTIKNRKNTFFKTVARQREKAHVQKIIDGFIYEGFVGDRFEDAEDFSREREIHKLKYAGIGDAPTSHGYVLSNYLRSEMLKSRSRTMSKDELAKYKYSISRFLGMCFSYENFEFPMTKDGLILRSRKKKQNVSSSSIYYENRPMSSAVIESIERMESMGWIDIDRQRRKVDIHVKGELLDMQKLLKSAECDFKLQRESIRLVDNAKAKNPKLLEYSNTKAINAWRQAVTENIRVSNSHQVLDSTSEHVVSNFYINLENMRDIELENGEYQTRADVMAHDTVPKGEYYFKGSKLQFVGMSVMESLNASVKIYKVAKAKLKEINIERIRKNKDQARFASYKKDGIPCLITTGGVYVSEEAKSFLYLKHDKKVAPKVAKKAIESSEELTPF